jgi:hypothetical protein
MLPPITGGDGLSLVEALMARKAADLTTLALMALASQGVASVPDSSTSAHLSRALVEVGTTGLTADDLVVGLDGAVQVDVKPSRMKMACSDNLYCPITANGCC